MPELNLDIILGNGKSDPIREPGLDLDTILGTTAGPKSVKTTSYRKSDPADNVPTPEKFEAGVRERGVNNYTKDNSIKKATLNALSTWGGNIADEFMGGLNQSIQGIGEVFTNKPAAGAGDIGIGLLRMGASIPVGTAISSGKAATELTGDPVFGKKAELIVGTALPVSMGNIIGKGSILNKALVPKERAMNEILDEIKEKDLPEIVKRLKSNDRLTLMDVSKPIQNKGSGLAAITGPHQQTLLDNLKNRSKGANQAVDEYYDEAMGVPVNIVDKLDKMKLAAREIGNKEIQPALAISKPVDISKVITDIDAKLKPGVNSVISAGDVLPSPEIDKAIGAVRKLLTDDKSVRTDPKQLHEFQSALRAKADDLLNSTDGQNRQIGKALMNVRNKMVDAIDNASGGTYKPALSKYRDEMQIQDAFKKGQLITKNRLGQLDDHPDFWEKWIEKASKEELEAAREGARFAIDVQINSARNAALKGETIAEVPFNKEKLSMLFGKKETNKLFDFLHDEREMAQTYADAFLKSQTAQRLKGAQSVEERPSITLQQGATKGLPIAALGALEGVSTYYGNQPGLTAAGAVLTAVGAKTANVIGRKIDRAKQNEMAKIISSTGKEKEELIQILENKLKNVPSLTMMNKLRLNKPTFTLPIAP